MGTPTPKSLIVRLVREQGGFPSGREAVCPFCFKKGVSDPHHWLYKRSDHVPDEVLHTPENVVMLCHLCHTLYGQTGLMTVTCLIFKLRMGYKIFEWVDWLIENGSVKHRPDTYGLETLLR